MQLGTRLEYLDAMRGIAAALVVIFHFSLWTVSMPAASGDPYFSKFTLAITEYFDLGKCGVVMFFCISGYVISMSLSRQVGSRPQVLRRFAWSRFWRLYPAYWLSLVFALFAGGNILWPELSVPTFLANLTMVQQYIGFESVQGLYWTLHIEILFYILVSILYFHFGINSQRVNVVCALAFLAAAVLLAAMRFHLHMKFPVAIPLALSIMFWAASWRLFQMTGEIGAKRASLAVILLLLICLPPICLLAYNFDLGHQERWDRYVVTYFAALLIFMICTTLRKPTNRVAVFLGAISYALYLFHPIIYHAVPEGWRLAVLNSYGPWALIALMIGLVIGAASIVHFSVERPMLDWARKRKK